MIRRRLLAAIGSLNLLSALERIREILIEILLSLHPWITFRG
jgi:hypothetical protein